MRAFRLVFIIALRKLKMIWIVTGGSKFIKFHINSKQKFAWCFFHWVNYEFIKYDREAIECKFFCSEVVCAKIQNFRRTYFVLNMKGISKLTKKLMNILHFAKFFHLYIKLYISSIIYFVHCEQIFAFSVISLCFVKMMISFFLSW